MENRVNAVAVRIGLATATLATIICAALPMRAAAGDSNAGQTAANFLRIGFGARAAALAGAATSVAGGAEAIYWNPAGLTDLRGRGEALLSHFSWYQDLAQEQGGLAIALSDRLAIGAAMTYLSYGAIEGYTSAGLPSGSEISAYDWSGTAAIGFDINEAVGLGVAAKWINQHLDDINATGYAVDLGVKARYGAMTLSAVLANWGPKMRYAGVGENLPTGTRVGLAWTSADEGLTAVIEYDRQQSGPTFLRQGLELQFDERYSLRVGYAHDFNNEIQSFASGLSLGAAARLGQMEISYAFSPGDSFANESVHRFAVTLPFGR